MTKALLKYGLPAGVVAVAFAAAVYSGKLPGLDDTYDQTPTHKSMQISGAGASFPYPVYAQWAEAYNKDSGTSINYQSIGSGGGIKQIKERTVTFGASDKPLDSADLAESKLTQFPTILGGVVPVVHISGIENGELTLDGHIIADIYDGKITSWDDPQIKALNPDVDLPSEPVLPVYRADGSGTTFLFTTYLSQADEGWRDSIGANTSVSWPAGTGAKGNEGVANITIQTEGAIGYVEYAYAKVNNLTVTKLVNKDGQAIMPTSEAFQAAAANVDWASAKDFNVTFTNQPGEQSWPITGASFILLPLDPANKEEAAEALNFFRWSFANGDELAEQLEYVPLPDNVVGLVEESWQERLPYAPKAPAPGM